MPDSVLSRLSDVLAKHTGLYFPKRRWADLERGLAGVAVDLGRGRDARSVVQALLSGPPAQPYIEALASHLTVGETYFFRERRAFDLFENSILPGVVRERSTSSRRLRIWSAGCCTGEEVYSIAICLERCSENLQRWEVTLLGTDINPHFLRKATEGSYGDWSFRDTPPTVRYRYFEKQSNKRYTVQPGLRRHVRFSYLNLAEDTYPSLLNNTAAMDVIFCRNVLMYFSPDQATEVLRRLHSSLVEGGWLILSAADVSPNFLDDFERIEFHGGTCYRKRSNPGSKPLAVHRPHLPLPPVSAVPDPAVALETEAVSPSPEIQAARDGREPKLDPQGAESPEGESVAKAEDREESVDPCGMAKMCANAGQLAEASVWCERAIAADRLNPEPYYILATILQEQGRDDAAAVSLLRTLYLEPTFVLGHFTLANLRLSQRKYREASRCFRQTRALLGSMPPDEVVPRSDGLSVRRLLQIVDSLQMSMPLETGKAS